MQKVFKARNYTLPLGEKKLMLWAYSMLLQIHSPMAENGLT